MYRYGDVQVKDRKCSADGIAVNNYIINKDTKFSKIRRQRIVRTAEQWGTIINSRRAHGKSEFCPDMTAENRTKYN